MSAEPQKTIRGEKAQEAQESSFPSVAHALFRGPRSWASLVVALSIAMLSNSFASAAADQLQFLDGSFLLGSLHSIDAEHEVRWRHPGAKLALEFTFTNLHQVRFGHERPAMTNGPATCRFRFTNGDEVLGELIALDEDTLDLDTWFAGRLRAPRKALQSVTVMTGGYSTLYDGPTSTNGWKIGGNPAVVGANRVVLAGGLINFDPNLIINGRVAAQAGQAAVPTNSWVFHNGAFYSMAVGSLGRDFKLPPQSRIEFDVAWKGTPSLRFALYTDALDQFDYSSGYQLYLSSSYIYMMRRAGANVAGAVMPSTTVRLPTMTQKNRIHFEFRCNNEKGTVALFADGVLVQEWKDSGGPMPGRGISFYSQRSDLALRISNLRVSAWDGRNDEPAPAALAQETTVLLVNGDRVSGKLGAIKDGRMSFETPQAKLNVPLQRAVQIHLACDGTNTPPHAAAEVQASLHGGEKVSLQLEKWEDGKAHGTSAVFGKVSLNPQWVRQLLFNPHRPRLAADEFAFPGDGAPGFRD